MDSRTLRQLLLNERVQVRRDQSVPEQHIFKRPLIPSKEGAGPAFSHRLLERIFVLGATVCSGALHFRAQWPDDVSAFAPHRAAGG